MVEEALKLHPGQGSELISVEGLRVRPEWIDYNAHMNVAYYVLAFDLAVDEIFELIGLSRDYRARSGRSSFALESHVMWQRELHLDDPLRVTVQFLGFDGKRMHSIYHMYHAEAGFLAATSEWLQISVDMTARRSAPFEAPIAAKIQDLVARHRDLPKPPEVGRVMGVKS
ncbi:MAG: thioesterase family protein [Rhodospirillales bacterium]